jgi:hypothetical protein
MTFQLQVIFVTYGLLLLLMFPVIPLCSMGTTMIADADFLSFLLKYSLKPANKKSIHQYNIKHDSILIPVIIHNQW